MPLIRSLLVFALALPLAACAQSDVPRKPPRLLTNEQGCSITIDNQPTNPYQDPSPMDRACIGPYQLELPQNYYYNQMGPWHDGSFSLALEYPSLQPFKPGERINPSVDVGVRTIRIRYTYVGRIDVRQALRNAYTPRSYAPDDPAASLEGRIQGKPVHGLVPYFIDMQKIRNYQRARGIRETASVMKPDSHYDWYVSRDASGTIDQLIECTPREISESGVEYRDGKMVKKRIIGFAGCRQQFIIEELSTIVDVNYPREGLANWRKMEARARALLIDNISRKGASAPLDTD
ncbi:hypothetical protein [uncultured Stenotrophomonas sp.]|uniref:hypothetical protein n=1 Tax=uncultured Stenotrophomonas sp. TaxID=165438 RepID=UPI0025E3A406|nr:hypothetical protein [uncultured Stenotrophomonas sp.]